MVVDGDKISALKFFGGCLVVSLFFLVWTPVFATGEFVADGNVIISNVQSQTSDITANLFIQSGSEAESWSYSNGLFTVTNPVSSTFQVGSSDSAVVCLVVVNQGTNASTEVANSTPGTSVITLPSTAGTYAVYPKSISCGSATQNTQTTSTTYSSGGSGFVANSPFNLFLPLPTAPFGAPALRLVRNVSIGQRGTDIKNLQIFLNYDPITRIAQSGVGSPGKETTFFGPLTKNAVGRFQLKYGIVNTNSDHGFGVVGPKTRAKIQQLQTIVP